MGLAAWERVPERLCRSPSAPGGPVQRLVRPPHQQDAKHGNKWLFLTVSLAPASRMDQAQWSKGDRFQHGWPVLSSASSPALGLRKALPGTKLAPSPRGHPQPLSVAAPSTPHCPPGASPFRIDPPGRPGHHSQINDIRPHHGLELLRPQVLHLFEEERHHHPKEGSPHLQVRGPLGEFPGLRNPKRQKSKNILCFLVRNANLHSSVFGSFFFSFTERLQKISHEYKLVGQILGPIHRFLSVFRIVPYGIN